MSYHELLGLVREPFSNSPDPDLFYRSKMHMECLQQMEIAVRLRRGLNVVIGEVGAGKTTLCRQLIRVLGHDETIETHLLLDPYFKDSIDFLKTLGRFLGLAEERLCDDAVALKDGIKSALLVKGASQGRTVTLIIDEGQKLTGECLELLRELLNFETNSHKLLQIVIFGQREFLPLLTARPNLDDRVNYRFILKHLDYPQTRRMIETRLALCARDTYPPDIFTTAALRSIHRHTGGSPRRIVQLCHKAVLTMVAESRRKVTWRLVRRSARVDRPEGRAVWRGRLAWAGTALWAAIPALYLAGATPADLREAVRHGVAAGVVEKALSDHARQAWDSLAGFVDRALDGAGATYAAATAVGAASPGAARPGPEAATDFDDTVTPALAAVADALDKAGDTQASSGPDAEAAVVALVGQARTVDVAVLEEPPARPVASAAAPIAPVAPVATATPVQATQASQAVVQAPAAFPIPAATQAPVGASPTRPLDQVGKARPVPGAVGMAREAADTAQARNPVLAPAPVTQAPVAPVAAPAAAVPSVKPTAVDTAARTPAQAQAQAPAQAWTQTPARTQTPAPARTIEAAPAAALARAPISGGAAALAGLPPLPDLPPLADLLPPAGAADQSVIEISVANPAPTAPARTANAATFATTDPVRTANATPVAPTSAPTPTMTASRPVPATPAMTPAPSVSPVVASTAGTIPGAAPAPVAARPGEPPRILGELRLGTGMLVSKSAARLYGHGGKSVLKVLSGANPDLGDLDKVRQGQTVSFPAIAATPPPEGACLVRVASATRLDAAFELMNRLSAQNGPSGPVLALFASYGHGRGLVFEVVLDTYFAGETEAGAALAALPARLRDKAVVVASFDPDTIYYSSLGGRDAADPKGTGPRLAARTVAQNGGPERRQ